MRVLRNVGHLVLCSVFFAASVASAGAKGKTESETPGAGLDKSKCNDVANLQDHIEGLIKRAITEQQNAVKNTQPAVAYDLNPSSPKSSRTTAQVREMAKALVAAINNPNTAARNASFALNGDNKRRAALKVYSQCHGEPIQTAIENNKYAKAIGRCSQGGSPVSTGLHATQVFETAKSVDEVQDGFVKKMVEPSEGTTVMSCKTPCKAYAHNLPKDFPRSGGDYMVRVGRDYGFGYSMNNETALRVTTIPLCKSEIRLVSALSLPQRAGDKGFNNSTLLGVVAPIGGKTVVFGSFSAQAFRKTSETPMPLTFLEYYDRYINEIFAKYDSVASIVGSAERAVNGILEGRPGLVPMDVLPGPKAAQRAAQ